MEPEDPLPCSLGLSTSPCPQLDQSSSYHPTLSLWDQLKWFSHLRLGFPSVLFPTGFPTNILYAFLFSPIRATCHDHRILLDFIIILREEYKLWNSALCNNPIIDAVHVVPLLRALSNYHHKDTILIDLIALSTRRDFMILFIMLFSLVSYQFFSLRFK
jgi:hypothetical protein